MRWRSHLSAWAEAREVLRTKDAACPNCSYNLRGNQNGTCPECGQSFDMIAAGFGTVPEGTPRPALSGMAAVMCGAVMNLATAGIILYALEADPTWQYLAFLGAMMVLFSAWRQVVGDRLEWERGLTPHPSLFWLICDFIGYVVERLAPSEYWVASAIYVGTAIHIAYAAMVALG